MKRFYLLLVLGVMLSNICKAQQDTSSYPGGSLMDTTLVKHGTYRYGIYASYDIFDRTPVFGIRYYLPYNLSAEFAYGYYAGPTYNPATVTHNGSFQYHNDITGIINMQIRPTKFIVSLIYKNEIKTSATSQSSNNFIYATIGLMTHNKISFHGRFGVGHIVGARQDRSGKEYIQPYANIGIGFNFNVIKKRANIHQFNEDIYKSMKD